MERPASCGLLVQAILTILACYVWLNTSKDLLNEPIMFSSFSCYCCCWAVPLFQVLGVGEVARFPRRDKSWWEAEHITPTLVALALLHQLSLLSSCCSCYACYPSLHCCYLPCCHSPFGLCCGPFPIRCLLLLFCVIRPFLAIFGNIWP